MASREGENMTQLQAVLVLDAKRRLEEALAPMNTEPLACREVIELWQAACAASILLEMVKADEQ